MGHLAKRILHQIISQSRKIPVNYLDENTYRRKNVPAFTTKSKNFPMQLDSQDRQLLRLLQQDCRLSNAELAEAAGLSASSCWRRIRTLESAGLISRYGAILSPTKLGLDFHAIVQVKLTRHDRDQLDQFIRDIRARPEVVECFATTGGSDYHLRVLVPDITAYNRFLEEVLFRLPAVESAETNVVLREIKPPGGIPI